MKSRNTLSARLSSIQRKKLAALRYGCSPALVQLDRDPLGDNLTEASLVADGGFGIR
jgi:hypothetical protein